MSGFLSRFKRSPSRSSSKSDEDSRRRRSSTASSSQGYRNSEDEHSVVTPVSSNGKSPRVGRAGSTFIEDLPDAIPSSPSTNIQLGESVTPDQNKHKPSPLVVPSSHVKAASSTPKLVLTDAGSNSPHSFGSSPHLNASPGVASPSKGLGLGLGAISTSSSRSGSGADSDLETPTVNGHFNLPPSPRNTAMNHTEPVPATAPVDADHLSSQADPRLRSNSVSSTTETRHSRSGSLVNRLAHKTNSPTNHTNLFPVDSRNSSVKEKKSKKEKKKEKKGRSRSTSSGVSGPTGSIAAALAKSGLHIAAPGDAELVSSSQSYVSSKKSSNRSPWLVRGKDAGDDDSYLRAEGDDELSRLDSYDDDDDDDDDEDTDSDLDENLPVTGFAVASNRRQADFHTLFSTVDEGDYLIEDYGCALSKDILVQGRLYVSENHLCFHANIFGWVTDVVIPFTDIRTIEKKMTALVIPNAIGVSTHDAKYTFASFISRDTTFDVLMNIWRLCNPNAVMSTTSFHPTNGSRPASVAGDDAPDSAGQKAPGTGKSGKGHAKTECACGKDGKHYSETAMDATFHSTPEKVYNLMFNSEWYKTFLSDNQKLKDVEMSDWRPSEETKNLMRSTSYIKPLNGSIGPKQTKCHITDEHQHKDFDDYISMLTTTKTPDVPSGGVFSVKTRTCFTWAGANSTKVVVTTTVEWTGKSWVKGIIEKSAIDGQKQYHEDLETGMKAYIKEHSSEFAGAEGVDEEEDEEAKAEEEAKPTEAAAYAAQQRKERQERDYWSMQGGLDMVISGIKSIFGGLKAVVDALTDILSDVPLTKETILGGIIALLVFSNIYTYFAFRSTEGVEVRRAKKLGHKAGLGDDDVEEAMRLLLRDRIKVTPIEEARDLERILDSVESRVTKLRSTLRSAVSEGQTRGLNDLE